jgi:hypothetical protein
MLDWPGSIYAGQAGFEYPATSVPFSNSIRPASPRGIWEALRFNACEGTLSGAGGNRRIRGHSHGAEPASLPELGLWVSACSMD